MSRLVENLLRLRDKMCSDGLPKHTSVEDCLSCMADNYPSGGGGGGGVIIEASVKEDDASCLILPITTTEIAEQIASGKDVAIKAVIPNSEGKNPSTVLFRFAYMNEVITTMQFVGFYPSFNMSKGHLLGAVVLEMGYGEPQTEAYFNYVKEE